MLIQPSGQFLFFFNTYCSQVIKGTGFTVNKDIWILGF